MPFRFVGSTPLLEGEVLGYWREERKNQVRHEYAPHENQWFDRDRYHEGHWGWRADEIVAGRPLAPDSGRLSDWLGGYTADVALVHLGTTDAIQGESAASIAGDLERVVATLRADNPRIAVLLAKLIPTADEEPSQPGLRQRACRSDRGRAVDRRITGRPRGSGPRLRCRPWLDNRAANGRSTRSFRDEGRWQAVLDAPFGWP